MKVTVFGTGYVGLVQAAVLAEVGHEVCCVDVDANKISNLKKGIVPIYEPGLSTMVQENHEAGRLHFTTEAAHGVEFGDLQFIAVGTPADEDGSADLQYVLKVAETIATFMNTEKIVLNKSTVPVGTADKVRSKIDTVLNHRQVALPFHVASNPEFLKEGSAVSDCMRPERIIIGTDSNQVEEKLRELYAPFSRNHDKLIIMDVRSAELTKYAANCMLATKISFMNEMANLAERLGADIESVRKGIGSDPRIGYHFIYPGCGYGGSCFPKDVQALKMTAQQIGYDAKILRAVEDTNNQQKHKLFEMISKYYGNELKGKTFALWGLSFKPDTDDMREAPSRVLMEELWHAGAKVQAYDPEAMEECQRLYGHRDDLTLCGTKETALNNADALIICTEWKNFRAPDFSIIKERLTSALIFDGRNLFNPQSMTKHNLTYICIGRQPAISR
ncbi:UDP-glucose 6-dehydrogenase [Pokkaliibacter plantistimulans]|uniref:UDP-glucose 6-dehydrogenase n=1 Tax=Proteobacteria bacterium 228 TaxID=2083153 RepID=A0A2S5KJK4_9PROT|nr:UDP-glucose/GDP-mannose dehydrogenase family protein [Pokkaliibacter plantistimulans]PPC74950.1 UDP-glucose 6-dehydrogenase [Pokkaliibacter plantistimulans]